MASPTSPNPSLIDEHRNSIGVDTSRSVKWRRNQQTWSDEMKKTIIALAVAGLTLVSAVAYAQMQHGQGGKSSMHSQHGTTGQGAMHGNRHGGMMQSGMMQGSKHGSMSGSQSMQPKGDTGPVQPGVSWRQHEDA